MRQCCIPCIEGLLPAPHNDSVLKLLYLASYWHSLAKLRLHSETTLKVLDNVTSLLARALRYFKEVTCPCFNTVETEREYNARRRAADRRMSRQQANAEQLSGAGAGGKRHKTFNLLMSKLHALGDYVENIKVFGTTDSYSTQIVRFQGGIFLRNATDVTGTQGELEHRNTKNRYIHTNKQDYIDQMVNREGVEKVHEKMNDEMVAATAVSIADSEEGPSAAMPPPVDLDTHTDDFPASGHWCRIAQDQSNKVYLPHLLSDPQNATDPAFKVSFSLKCAVVFRC
jgi:hypothetical protein